MKLNKEKQKMLDGCVKLNYETMPEIILDSIYIIPTSFKHESGYKIMYIIGIIKGKKYILDTICDVIDLGHYNLGIKDIHIDITPSGIIHLWSNCQKFKNTYRYSNCSFRMIEEDDK